MFYHVVVSRRLRSRGWGAREGAGAEQGEVKAEGREWEQGHSVAITTEYPSRDCNLCIYGRFMYIHKYISTYLYYVDTYIYVHLLIHIMYAFVTNSTYSWYTLRLIRQTQKPSLTALLTTQGNYILWAACLWKHSWLSDGSSARDTKKLQRVISL